MTGRRDDATCMYSLLYSENCPFLISKWAFFAVQERLYMQLASSRRPAIASHGYTAIQRYTLYSYTALYSIHAIHHPSALQQPQKRACLAGEGLRCRRWGLHPWRARQADHALTTHARLPKRARPTCGAFFPRPQKGVQARKDWRRRDDCGTVE